MIDDSLRIFTLKNYIHRIWIWLTNFGIVLSIIGAALIYNHFGFWDPVRCLFNEPRLRFWTMAALSATAGCVSAAVMIGTLLINSGISVKINIEPHTAETAEPEIKQALVAALTSKISSLESALWFLAGCPAIIGVVLFAMGRSAFILFLYVGISLLTGIIFLPSLDLTERLIEKHISQHLPSIKPKESG